MEDLSSFLPQGIDYLGFLDAKLRDLRGYTTLAHEFLQNADDAAATEVIFDFRVDALFVQNNKVFTDCDQVGQPECPWKRDPTRGHRCDFHRFRLVAGRDKRDDSDTIGAFGIGFISVYQITDRPELSSGNRHWIIRPEEPERSRIEQERNSTIADTVFRLPWAFQQNGALRKALSLEPVTLAGIEQFKVELARSLPLAILFLRNVRCVELRVEGHLSIRIDRSATEDRLVVRDGEHHHAWQVFTGNFQIEASNIKKHSGGRIEAKRRSEVTIAIPGPAVDSAGLLYAFLPTEHRTGLPLNINGDFFPSSDRKRVLLDTGDYQQVWNEAAIRAAARVFAENCLAIRDFLGEKGFWKALQELEQVAHDAEGIRQNAAFGAFWEALKDKLPHLEVVKTSAGAWKRPVEVCLLRGKEEEEALPVLECIGLHVVHPDLRFAQNLLTKSEVGVPILKLSDLAMALQRCGLTERAPLKSAPNWIQSATNREQLGGEIESLREQRVAIAEREAALQKIRGCSIAVAENGDLAPPSSLRRASRKTMEVFESFGGLLYFLALENPQGIAELNSEFTLEDAVRLIEGISSEVLLKLWRQGAEHFKCLIGWFADHRPSIRGSQTMQTRLRNLVIWPSGKSLYPLTDLTVPGNFEDALHLARIVDLEFLGEYRDFLIELGARELTFSTYALAQVPHALSVDADISRDVRRAVLQLLATRMGEFTYLPESREKLAACPIAECTDGIFRAPAHVYFDAPNVKKLLGSDVSVVLLSPERETAVREFLKWLGVAERPRPRDIIEKIRSLVQGTAESDKRVSIQRIFGYLGRLWGREEDQDEFAFRELKTLAWLPIHGDLKTWYVPAKIYAIYSSHLFETQARFLDVPRQEQGQASEFIRFLEMGVEPSPVQVVNHLLARAKEKSDVNRDVYRFLTQKAEDPAILRLRGTACLLLDGVGYAHPDQVFWGPHAFGRFRFQLPSDHGVYKPLFERLGVHETPDAEDSIKVLSGISDEYGSSNQPLDDATFQVVMQCWKLIEDFLNTGRLDARKLQMLNTRKVVADDRKLLQCPNHMFFDDRAGLASRFKDLIQHNVIVRPLGAWHAMEAAGVQPLSRAVKTSLVECDGPVEATDIVARLTDRHTLIARVIEAHRTDTSGWKLEVFERLTVERAPRLGVTHTLKAFGQVRTTPYEEVPVYYDADNEALYLRNDSPPPWAAIARELAFAVNPDLEPGAIAPGFKEVLNANSVEEATQILDDLGYPSLEVHSAQQLTSAPVGLGGSAPPPPGLDDANQLGSSSSSFQASVTTTQDALRALGISTNPEPLPPSLDKQEAVSSGTARSSRKGRGSQLRTYVAPEGEATASDMDEDEKRRRSSLAKAGVKRVMDYEQYGGRNPIEMPVNYPGYDIEARNQDGAVVRFIEVKSVTEDWNRRGVGLSREQFDRASELGEKYWLYVVENAEGDEFHIYRIQDPARKTNQFFYDDGWIGLAEEEEAGPLGDPVFS